MDTKNRTTRTASAILLLITLATPFPTGAVAQQLRQPFLQSIEELAQQKNSNQDAKAAWNHGWREGVEQLAQDYGVPFTRGPQQPSRGADLPSRARSFNSTFDAQDELSTVFSTPPFGTPVTNSISSGAPLYGDNATLLPSRAMPSKQATIMGSAPDRSEVWPPVGRQSSARSPKGSKNFTAPLVPFSRSVEQLEQSNTPTSQDSARQPAASAFGGRSRDPSDDAASSLFAPLTAEALADADRGDSEDGLYAKADQPTPANEGGPDSDDLGDHEEPEYWPATYRPNAVGKRLFNYGYNKEADVTATGLVDLSEPFATPHADHQAGHIPFHHGDFTPLPDYSCFGYDPGTEMTPYYGKSLNRTQRPWVELGRGMYLNGPIPPSKTWMGCTNPIAPHFLVYGDYRTAIGYVDGGDGDFWVNAHRLNLDLDLKITATERIHAFIGPLDRGLNFTRVVSDGGDVEFQEEFDADFDTIYFEGDLGAMIGGFMGIYPPFDMPIAFGIIPMLFQNGTWLNDNFLGAAVTIPAKNSPRLQWSNFDVTFFAGMDEINSDAFRGDDSLANIYGVHGAIEAYQGYLEIGYAFLDDTLSQGLGYHNIGVSFSRRYGQRISNSVRFIANMGQDPVSGEQTADGQLLLIENALITKNYTSFVPYMNFFAGFGRPQSAARAGVAGGVLLNTGINFETDGLTGFPTLDATANDTAGGAVGINWLGDSIDWQLITEFAAVRTHGNDPNRNIPDDQYAFGVRYQRPISNAWLIRLDGMHGIRKGLSDLSGARFELRYKF